MAVTISGSQLNTNTSWQSSETLTQSTATVARALSTRTDVSILGMGTATGSALRNLYSLGAGVEGQIKLITSTATGEASVVFTQQSGRLSVQASLLAVPAATAVDAIWASATGMWVFNAADDYLLLMFANGAWDVIGGKSATLATTT